MHFALRDKKEHMNELECMHAFYPETLDLFIVGCSTEILKDDLAKMGALMRALRRVLEPV